MIAAKLLIVVLLLIASLLAREQEREPIIEDASWCEGELL